MPDKKKKLSLNRDTMGALTAKDLRKVAGGGLTDGNCLTFAGTCTCSNNNSACTQRCCPTYRCQSTNCPTETITP